MAAVEAEVAPDRDLRPIAELCDGEVSFRIDGWRHLIFMQGLRFYANGVEQKMDALLCLNHNNATYPTKLYLEKQIGTGLNWNEQAYILGRTWFTFSWRDIQPTLTPIEILAAHLGPLNPPQT